MRAQTRCWDTDKIVELPPTSIDPTLLQLLVKECRATFGRMEVVQVDHTADFVESVISVTIWLRDPTRERKQ
jgi:hypothetical protein